VVLILGVWNLLLATVLFPLVRRLNGWLFGWVTRIGAKSPLPFFDLHKRFLQWWLAQETLQRAVGMVLGLILLVVWWLVWGPGALGNVLALPG
jgi:hypothetical protein